MEGKNLFISYNNNPKREFILKDSSCTQNFKFEKFYTYRQVERFIHE